MICQNCGATVNPNEKFCGNCGAEVEMATMLADDMPAAENPYAQPAQPAQPQYAQPAQPQYAQPAQPQYAQPQYAQPQYAQPQYAQPMYGQPGAAPGVNPAEQSLSGKILGFGIAAIACGVSFIASILGIIFGAIALKKNGEFSAQGFRPNGRSTTGKVLGIIGLVFGIIWTIYWLILIVACIASM